MAWILGTSEGEGTKEIGAEDWQKELPETMIDLENSARKADHEEMISKETVRSDRHRHPSVT